MDGFAVGAHCYEADEAGFCETDGVFLDGGDVEVFGFGVEKGHCWGVDSWEEGAAGGGGGGVTIAGAVCGGRHFGGYLRFEFEGGGSRRI